MHRQPQQSCKLRPVHNRRERGQAVVETAFMIPWIFFLFVGVLDFGFYSYALMTVENAARLAVLQTSASATTADNASVACPIVLSEMQSLSNIFNAASCNPVNDNCNPTTLGPATAAKPLYVGACSTTQATIDGLTDITSTVLVSYYSVRMIPIPGILKNQMIINRSAQMQVLLGP